MVHSEKGTISSIRRNELSSHENTWKKHKCVFLSEGIENDTYYMILII